MSFLKKPPSLNRTPHQRGVTLIELLVGISIGLLTIAVAMGALMVSRTVSSSVSDISQLQQQAAYAFRVIGMQLRQTGSLRLNLAAQKPDGAAIDMADPVAFETRAGDFDPASILTGIDAPPRNSFKITMGFRNYKEPVYTSAAEQSLMVNCLGQTTSATLLQSAFTLYIDPDNPSTRELRCNGRLTGNIADPQPMIQNVADFQVRYLMQRDSPPFGNPQIRYLSATAVGADWSRVTGVEVCLVLYGSETLEMPAGSSYTDCDGTTAIDMTALPAPRTRRIHAVFKNIYQIRSQGLAVAK